MSNKYNFPKEFLWAAATSAEQSEGRGKTKKAKTIWDLHYEKFPNMFFDDIGPEHTNEFASYYEQDIPFIKENLNLNAIRLSFSWSRIFLDENTINKQAIDYYHSLLDLLKKNKIKPLMTIYHFDTPAWIAKKGGFTNKEVVEHYFNFAILLFKEFGEKVHLFQTFCEPIVSVMCSYMGLKAHWPCIEDYQLAFDAGNNMILAHAKVVNWFKENKIKSKIGFAPNLSPVHCRNKNNIEDLNAAKNYNLLHNKWMIDSMLLGEYPIQIKDLFQKLGANYFNLSKEELKIISKVKLDFVGINYYFPTRIKKYENEKVEAKWQKLMSFYKWEKAIINHHRGWEIYPKDILSIAKLIKEKYDNIPFYISENGIGISQEEKYRNPKTLIIEDDYRIDFIKNHLIYVHKVIEEGAPIFGYTVWAVFDCWSWLNAYKNRYGLIEIDLKTLKRKVKKSGIWFKELASNNGFS